MCLRAGRYEVPTFRSGVRRAAVAPCPLGRSSARSLAAASAPQPVCSPEDHRPHGGARGIHAARFLCCGGEKNVLFQKKKPGARRARRCFFSLGGTKKHVQATATASTSNNNSKVQRAFGSTKYAQNDLFSFAYGEFMFFPEKCWPSDHTRMVRTLTNTPRNGGRIAWLSQAF